MRNVTARLHEDTVDNLDDEADEQGVSRSEHICEVLRQAYRDVLAQTTADLTALYRLRAPTRQTPRWAADRFPELVGVGAQVGRAWGHNRTEIADVALVNPSNR
jgi:Ribbon-helix-helix protein, copG family.